MQHSFLLPESTRVERRAGPGPAIARVRSGVAILPTWDDSDRRT